MGTSESNWEEGEGGAGGGGGGEAGKELAGYRARIPLKGRLPNAEGKYFFFWFVCLFLNARFNGVSCSLEQKLREKQTVRQLRVANLAKTHVGSVKFHTSCLSAELGRQSRLYHPAIPGCSCPADRSASAKNRFRVLWKRFSGFTTSILTAHEQRRIKDSLWFRHSASANVRNAV